MPRRNASLSSFPVQEVSSPEEGSAVLVSVVVPTWNEVESIGLAILQIAAVLKDAGLSGEILVMDDDSPDGTVEAARRVSASASAPVRTCARKGRRGVSASVMEGFELARGEACVLMDADLSHPAASIPRLVEPVLAGSHDLVVGSRYMEGGQSLDWPKARQLLSRWAAIPARRLCKLTDPLSGFFAVRKSFLDGIELSPTGWKIGLEIAVRGRPRLLEIPIVFTGRRRGQSKLGLRAALDYLAHLQRLFAYRYSVIAEESSGMGHGIK